MHTRGTYARILGAALAVALLVLFVVSVRTGLIHDAAWHDACADLARGEAITGLHDTTNHCTNA